jgi:hypothetical protein
MDPHYKVYFRNFPEPQLLLDVLNDDRSWGVSVGATSKKDDADWIVTTLTSQGMKKRFPGQDGKLSLTLFEEHQAPETFFNTDNWVRCPNPDFQSQDAYKIYLVNHEFGHVLMYGHRMDKPGYCPVMYQQTKQGKCWPCPWPRLCGDLDDDLFDRTNK